MPRAPKAAPAKAAPKLLKTKTMAATADAATEWQAKAKKTEAKKAVAAAAASKKASSESRRAAVATGKKAKAAESAKKAKVAAAVRARADGAPALSYKQLTAEAVLALGGRSASLASIKKHILANHPSAGIVPAALFNKHVSSALAKLVQDGAFKRDANSYSTADGKQAKAIAAGGGEKKAAAAATTKKTTTTATKKAAPKKTAAASDDAEEVATVAMITGPPDPTKTYAYGDATAYCYHDVSSTFFVQCVNSEGQAMTTKPPGVPGLAAYLVRIRDNSGRVNCTMSWDTPFPGYYKMTYPPLNTWTDNYWLYVTYLGANCKDVPYFVATYRGGLNGDGTVASASPYSDRRIPRALMTAGTATEAPRPIGEYLKRLTMKSAAWAATSKNYFAAAGQKVPPPAVPKKKGGTVLAPMAMPYPSNCYAYGSEYYLSWTNIPSQFWVQGYDVNGNPPSPTAGNRLQIRIWSIYGSYVNVLYSTKCDANGVYTFNIPGLACENFFYQIYFEGLSNKIQDQPVIHYVDNPPPSFSAAKSATPSRKGAATTTTTTSTSSSSSSATADDAQIYGPNADKCVAGEDSTIFVHLTDASSAPLKSGGAAVTARFKRAGAGGTWTAVDVTDQKNGGYRLSYVIADAGNYTLQVLLNGSAVKGSPLSIECTEAGAVGSKRSKASASPAKKPKASAAKKVKVTAGADASPKKKAAPKKAASPKKKAATSPKKKAAPKKK